MAHEEQAKADSLVVLATKDMDEKREVLRRKKEQAYVMGHGDPMVDPRMVGDTSNGTVSAAEDAARKAQKEVEEADLKVARRKSHMLDMAEYLKTMKAQMKAMKRKLLALKRLGGKRLVAMMKKIAARKKKEAEMARDLERQRRESLAEEKARKAAIARLAAAERKAAKVEEAAKRKAAEKAKEEGVAGLFGLSTGGT